MTTPTQASQNLLQLIELQLLVLARHANHRDTVSILLKVRTEITALGAANLHTADLNRQLMDEASEQARIIGMGAERELALMAKVGRLQRICTNVHDAILRGSESDAWLMEMLAQAWMASPTQPVMDEREFPPRIMEILREAAKPQMHWQDAQGSHLHHDALKAIKWIRARLSAPQAVAQWLEGQPVNLTAAATDAGEWLDLIERLHRDGQWRFSEADTLARLRGCRAKLREFLVASPTQQGVSNEQTGCYDDVA